MMVPSGCRLEAASVAAVVDVAYSRAGEREQPSAQHTEEVCFLCTQRLKEVRVPRTTETERHDDQGD